MENDKNEKSTTIVTIVLLTLAASFLYMMNCGIRNNFGIMLSAIIENAGLTLASVSFVLAVGQFCFGVTQPIFGIIADKKGNRFSLLVGIICTAAGIVFLPFCQTQWTLMLVLGILLPGGIGAISYGIIMDTVSLKIMPQYHAVVSGIVNASSGIGNTLLTPVISTAIIAGGLASGMAVLVVPTLLMIPITFWLCPRTHEKIQRAEKAVAQNASSNGELARLAVKNRDYLFIVIGFFTCGFHMALITNHLATQIVSYGYTFQESSYAFSVYGIATVVGALITGFCCAKFKMKTVLGTLYGLRAAGVALFFALPKTMPVICLYIFLLGFTGSSTVTPVSGICGQLFGQRGITILFGMAFFIHQIGGFCSAWLGGLCFEAWGNYGLIWTVDALLCIIAAIVSYLIKR